MIRFFSYFHQIIDENAKWKQSLNLIDHLFWWHRFALLRYSFTKEKDYWKPWNIVKFLYCYWNQSNSSASNQFNVRCKQCGLVIKAPSQTLSKLNTIIRSTFLVYPKKNVYKKEENCDYDRILNAQHCIVFSILNLFVY